jgi:hypothetical protein
MRITTALGRLLVGLGVASVIAWGTEPAVAQSLTADDVDALLKCQTTIQKEGQKFVKNKLKAVELCGVAITGLLVKEEQGLLTGPALDKAVAAAEKTCEVQLAKIEPASTKFVDKVLESCLPVEALIFAPGLPPDGDPLGFQSLIAFIEELLGATPGEFGIDTVEELAGALCVAKELVVDITAILEIPRLLDIFPLLATVPIDPRCTGGLPPV